MSGHGRSSVVVVMVIMVMVVMMAVIIIMMVVMVMMMMMIVLRQNHRIFRSPLVRRLLGLSVQDVDRIGNWIQQFRE